VKPEDVLGAVLRGVLTSRRKRHARTLRRLEGGHLLSTRNIITAAAAAWGLYEAWQNSLPGGVAEPIGSGPTPPDSSSAAPDPASRPFPLPTVGRSEAAAPTPPPLPTGSARASSPAAGSPAAADADHGFPPELARAIRLLIAAARADGDLEPEEGALIARHAAEAGAEGLVRAELQRQRSSAEIVHGVSAPGIAAELYSLAFAVLRADEDVDPDERRWLGELETLLKLDPPTARRLEEAVAGGIEPEGESEAEGGVRS
jgi:tellurite resistance protein